jgi:four helix bundle protein
MSNGKLEEFKAYQKSLELFDMVVNDISQSLQDRRLDRLVSQQLASADSVCSNIEEGYGRESTTKYRRFLIIARGSLRETLGRYKRLHAWLPEEVIKKRVVLAEEINRMLSSTIKRLADK